MSMTTLEALEHAKRELEAYKLKVVDRPFFQLEVDYLEIVVEALEQIVGVPTIDIVHCSECRYHGLEEAPTYCRVWFERTGNDGYCFKGERKNG